LGQFQPEDGRSGEHSIKHTLFERLAVDTDFIYQGARTAAGAFFVWGAKTLAPPPDLNASRAMLAAFLVMVALALWTMIEHLAAARLLDSTRKRKGKKPRRRNLAPVVVSNLVQDILSALGMAPANRGAGGRTHGRRR